jgi:hypothetical protein
MMSTAMSEHIVEYEEYYEEEEVLSYYDPGLSTISEGENESCSDTSSTLEASKSPRRQIGSASTSTSIPDNISLNLAMMNNPLQMMSLDSPCISLSSSLSSPRMSSKVNNFNIAALISPPLVDKKFQSVYPKLKSPIVTNLPLTLTSYMTGEEVFLDDDDDYTFLTCSDTDSHIDELSMSFTDLSVASSPSSVRSISSKGSCKGSSSMPLDFESTRSRLRSALESRTTREKNCVEKMDFLQRRLTYDLSRKMFKEQMARSRS